MPSGTAPAPDTFGAGAEPVQLFNNLTPVGPTLLQRIANGSVTVSVTAFPQVGFGPGGTVGLTLGASGGALVLGAGFGQGGDVKVTVSDTPPTTNLNAQLVLQGSTPLNAQPTPEQEAAGLQEGDQILGFKSTVSIGLFGSSATEQISRGPFQFIQTMPVGGSSGGLGPSTGDQPGGSAGSQAGAVRLLDLGSQTSLQVVGTIPFTFASFVDPLRTIGEAEVGLTPGVLEPSAPSPQDRINGEFVQLPTSPQDLVNDDFAQFATSPQDLINGDFGQLANNFLVRGAAVPFLVVNTPAGPLNTTDGTVGPAGEAVNPVTGLPGSIGGTTGSAFLPDQFVFPPGPATAPASAPSAPNTGGQPFFDPVTGLKLSGSDLAPANPDAVQIATTAPLAGDLAQPTAAQAAADGTQFTAGVGQPTANDQVAQTFNDLGLGSPAPATPAQPGSSLPPVGSPATPAPPTTAPAGLTPNELVNQTFNDLNPSQPPATATANGQTPTQSATGSPSTTPAPAGQAPSQPTTVASADPSQSSANSPAAAAPASPPPATAPLAAAPPAAPPSDPNTTASTPDGTPSAPATPPSAPTGTPNSSGDPTVHVVINDTNDPGGPPSSSA